MRILKIRSLKDFGAWTLDQALHALIGLASCGWFAQTATQTLGGTAIILTIREIEQGRETVEEYLDRKRDWEDPGWTLWELLLDLHLPDRIMDVTAGALLAAGAWIAIRQLVS